VASVIAVSRYYPETVISGITAMAIHELTDERIDRLDVDIERSRTIRNKLLRCHRVPRSRLIGIERIDFRNESIRIYDRERTLCEAYRIDPGGPLFFKALKRYLKQQLPDTNRIQRYDKLLKTKVIGHLQQELADD
jgi:predicted transcriptional regulator of viral defense system